jgi:hypothetical protein
MSWRFPRGRAKTRPLRLMLARPPLFPLGGPRAPGCRPLPKPPGATMAPSALRAVAAREFPGWGASEMTVLRYRKRRKQNNNVSLLPAKRMNSSCSLPGQTNVRGPGQ